MYISENILLNPVVFGLNCRSDSSDGWLRAPNYATNVNWQNDNQLKLLTEKSKIPWIY